MSEREVSLAVVLDLIRGAVGAAGSIRALARKWDVSAAYLCDVLHERRGPGKSILRHLNLRGEKIVSVHFVYTLDKNFSFATHGNRASRGTPERGTDQP